VRPLFLLSWLSDRDRARWLCQPSVAHRDGLVGPSNAVTASQPASAADAFGDRLITVSPVQRISGWRRPYSSPPARWLCGHPRSLPHRGR
jgi:hypothetical protein